MAIADPRNMQMPHLPCRRVFWKEDKCSAQAFVFVALESIELRANQEKEWGFFFMVGAGFHALSLN